MAKSNGFFQRGSSQYLRVALPKTHQPIDAYKSGKVVISLRTCYYREPVRLGAIKRAEILGLKAPNLKANTGSQQPTIKRARNSCYLRDVYARWKESKPRSIDAINPCMNVNSLFLTEFHITPNP